MVCGPTLERAEAVASKLGARAVTNIETILVDPTIDAVDICVPTLFHREVAERVLSRGKHVLLEKPIALRCKMPTPSSRQARPAVRS